MCNYFFHNFHSVRFHLKLFQIVSVWRFSLFFRTVGVCAIVIIIIRNSMIEAHAKLIFIGRQWNCVFCSISIWFNHVPCIHFIGTICIQHLVCACRTSKFQFQEIKQWITAFLFSIKFIETTHQSWMHCMNWVFPSQIVDTMTRIIDARILNFVSPVLSHTSH